MRKALWACVSLGVLVGFAAPCSWAVERELSGVRLGETAMDLLDKPGYGEPDFVGPLGTIAIAVEEPQGAAASRAGGAGRSGPAGPAGARAGGARGMRGGGMRGGGMRGGGMRGGGMRGGGMRGGGMRGGGMRGGGMRGGGMRGGGMRGGGMRGGGMRGGGMRGGGMRGGMGGATGARGRTAAAGERPGMYWYYKRPGNATVVLSLDAEGEVKAITLTGRAPSLGGVTSRGIGLASDYMEIIAQYSYPDQTVSAGTALELTYVDHGVRFTLDAMRVREIAIGAHIAAQAEVAPAVPEPTLPPAGMSIEELRGYL